jgi:neutral ceramidase
METPDRSAVPRTGAESPLLAGFARTDITPHKPVTLAGYGSRTGLCQGVHDPLSARVVAFQHDGRRLVLVSTDILGFYGGTAAACRGVILSACGLQPSELLLSAIHTHSAPDVGIDERTGHANNVEYVQTLQGRLVDVVRRALAGMAPAQVAAACGACPVGANRREVVTSGAGQAEIRLGRNPAGSTDRQVQVLAVRQGHGHGHADGPPAAVIFAYATHSTSLGPGNYMVSGDVHGLTEQFLERQLGNGAVAAGFAGASGDIDPWFRVLPEFDTRDGWTPEPVLLSTMLGEEVAHVLRRMPANHQAGGAIRTALRTLMLPAKPPQHPRPAGKVADRPASGAAQGDAPAPPAPAAPPAPTGVEFNLSAARLGDMAFVGLGGEVFHEIGLAIKAASPVAHTFIFTHCNGSAGYLPTAPSYDEGGYEVQTTPFAPAAAEQVILEATRMLREL